MGRAQRALGCWSLFFRLVSDAVFLDFLVDFGRFWEAKMVPKINFWEVFFDAFIGHDSGIDFGWFFGGSKREK